MVENQRKCMLYYGICGITAGIAHGYTAAVCLSQVYVIVTCGKQADVAQVGGEAQCLSLIHIFNAIYESYNTGKTVKIEVPEV